VPYGVGKRASCPASRPWAVYRMADANTPEKIVNGGCHATREDALAQQRALYARESAALLPGEEQVMPEHKTVPVEWKAATSGDPGELVGYASVFGNLDQGGDVVMPGAFTKTLAYWKRSGLPLPLIADHELTTEGVIGSVVEANEDGTGLRVRARFSSDPKAQSVRTKMLEGHLKGMSFTYDAVKHYRGALAGKAARFLQELKLYEATVTPFPMNELATASAKADSTKPYGDVPYADPGYLDADGNQASKTGKPGVKRYPLSADKVMAAWSYINQAKNAGQYTAEQVSAIKGRIRAAMKKFGHQVSEAAGADLRDAMHKVLEIAAEPLRKAAADALLDAYITDEPEDDAAPADEPEPAADGPAPDTPAEGETKSQPDGPTPQEYADMIANTGGPADGSPARLTELEAEITSALGRAS
jgi:HK97 family phage prohead protease